jgi:hypothetical protein
LEEIFGGEGAEALEAEVIGMFVVGEGYAADQFVKGGLVVLGCEDCFY